MRRPIILWHCHLVATALSVGCGAAAPAGAVNGPAPRVAAAEPATAPAPRRQRQTAPRAEPAPEPDLDAAECGAPDCERVRAGAKEPERVARAPVKRPDGEAGARRDGEARRERPNDRERSASAQIPADGVAAAPAPVVPTGGELVDRLFFARGSADLADHAQALDAIAKVVRAGEPVTIIVIGGADEREPAALARTRARAVRDALQARGVPGSWIVLAFDRPGPGPASYDQKVEIRLQEP